MHAQRVNKLEDMLYFYIFVYLIFHNVFTSDSTETNCGTNSSSIILIDSFASIDLLKFDRVCQHVKTAHKKAIKAGTNQENPFYYTSGDTTKVNVDWEYFLK